MPVNRFGYIAVMAGLVTLPLAGPVHADASAIAETALAPVSAAPVAAAAAISEATSANAAGALTVSQPVVQALPVEAAEGLEVRQEIGVGGILASHRAQGNQVVILTLSRGAQGGSPDDRQHESMRSAEVLGARLFLEDLADTEITNTGPTVQIIERVVKPGYAALGVPV